MTSKEKLLAITQAAMDKNGADLQILDLRSIQGFTDFFVIVTGTSDRHVRTLADSISEAAREFGERPLGVEGEQLARWVLIDLGDVVVHVFQDEARHYYNLERLWGEAEAVDLPRAAEA